MGEVVGAYASSEEPLGVTWVRCGDRRASQCPSCARLYAADMFQLIRAGVVGGKTVPASVADNPLVFATLTAPSFGPVHGRRDHNGLCHPRSGTLRVCAHGRPTGCAVRHGEDDPRVGAAAVPGLLRLRLPRALAVVVAGPVEAVHHPVASPG